MAKHDSELITPMCENRIDETCVLTNNLRYHIDVLIKDVLQKMIYTKFKSINYYIILINYYYYYQ